MTWTVDPDGTGSLDTTVNGGMPIMQFQVGALLTASVTDGDIAGNNKNVAAARDDVAADPTWRWYRGGTRITDSDAEDNTYTVTTADDGKNSRWRRPTALGTAQLRKRPH